MLQGLVNPIDATNALSQDCSAFKTASKHPTGSLFTNVQTGGDDFMTYLRFVQGGYTQAEYDAYTQSNLAATSVLVEQCVSKVKKANYGSATVDHSYPRCSTRLRWTVGDYGGDTWTMSDGQVYSGPQYDTRIRSVIWSMLDSSTCQSNWLADVLSTVGPEFGVTLDTWTSNPLFVIPDPDEQFLETQPGFSQITLMDLVEQFALGQLEAKTTPIFYGTGSVPPGSSQLTSENGIVVFNTAMLPVYSVDDPAYQANLLSLTPTAQYDLGIEVYAGDQNTNETCVFSPSDDPNIGDIYAQNQDACTPEALPGQQSGLTDHVYVCKTGSGELVCSKVPEAYKRNGYYGCGYTPTIQSTCTEDPSVASTCVYPQLNALYQQFTRCYQAEQPAVPSLPTESLPWLPGSPWGVPFSFVLAEAIAYQTNIQPDKTKPIMCNVDTTASQAINFSQCTSPHYERLKQHTQANYMHEGGVVVPPLTQLEWTVDQGLLARGVIMAYSQTERPIESTFMQVSCFRAVCVKTRLTLVCRRSSTTPRCVQALYKATSGYAIRTSRTPRYRSTRGCLATGTHTRCATWNSRRRIKGGTSSSTRSAWRASVTTTTPWSPETRSSMTSCPSRRRACRSTSKTCRSRVCRGRTSTPLATSTISRKSRRTRLRTISVGRLASLVGRASIPPPRGDPGYPWTPSCVLDRASIVFRESHLMHLWPSSACATRLFASRA